MSGCIEKQDLIDKIKQCTKIDDIKPKDTPPNQERTSNSDQNQCVICFDAMITTVFLECGHVACCKKCASLLNQCPICRRYISRVVDIYMAT